MTPKFIREQDFKSFVTHLMAVARVVGPVAKRGKFVFARLSSSDELRLDYDVTILPPKKLFFPPAQDLVRFEGGSFSGCINPVDTILLGVHFYDVKAIDQTDLLFRERHADQNYLAQRAATTIIASNVQNIAPRAFWGSVGSEVQPKGHDAFVTRIQGGYVYEARTPKGEQLVASGSFQEATAPQIEMARTADQKVMSECPERLKHSSSEIAVKVRGAFKNKPLWEELAHDCFSCGSCNTVCPTCYCFDIQDTWNVDQGSGMRTRYWDACLTEEFAAVTLAAGAFENFRDERGDRFRHRFMRKASYLNDTLGSPACVGCGRCSQACTADIADPVNVINRIMEAYS
jgi:formate hydrogenlyase subunit 6/NADH:ubiquinone oxidoreductase subunit I